MPRILIVEDDAPLRNAVRSTLEQSGYEVDVAADGAVALKALNSAVYDVLLLDIGLPFVDGWQRILLSSAGQTVGHNGPTEAVLFGPYDNGGGEV
jgi:DNA-binding response OmpR family regulator